MIIMKTFMPLVMSCVWSGFRCSVVLLGLVQTVLQSKSNPELIYQADKEMGGAKPPSWFGFIWVMHEWLFLRPSGLDLRGSPGLHSGTCFVQSIPTSRAANVVYFTTICRTVDSIHHCIQQISFFFFFNLNFLHIFSLSVHHDDQSPVVGTIEFSPP